MVRLRVPARCFRIRYIPLQITPCHKCFLSRFPLLAKTILNKNTRNTHNHGTRMAPLPLPRRRLCRVDRYHRWRRRVARSSRSTLRRTRPRYHHRHQQTSRHRRNSHLFSVLHSEKNCIPQLHENYDRNHLHRFHIRKLDRTPNQPRHPHLDTPLPPHRYRTLRPPIPKLQ